MREVSELSHKDYKVTITKMLRQAIANVLETIKKQSQQINRGIMDNQMEILELQIIIKF